MALMKKPNDELAGLFDGPILGPDDIRLAEARYQEELTKSPAAEKCGKARYQYAKSLLRSKSPADHKRSVTLLEELFDSQKSDTPARCEILLNLAVAYLKTGEKFKALAAVQRLLVLDPTNSQARALEVYIQERLEEKTMLNMALFGGALMAVGSLIGIAIGRSSANR